MRWYNFLYCIISLQIAISSQQNLKRSTLLISLDSFRHDFIYRIRDLVETENGKQSNFWRLIRKGAFSEDGISTTFATLTLPIHYGIATGLYEESHGVIGNNLYDPILRRRIDLPHTNSTDHAWAYGGEPIWKTLQKQTPVQNRKDVIGCIMWVGCEVADLNRFWRFTPNQTLDSLVDRAIEWLTTGSQLVMIYHDRVDTVAHEYGPDSKEMNETLILIDQEIGYLIGSLESKNLLKDTNLILMADHGLLSVESIKINGRFPTDLFDIWSHAQPIWLVEPKSGMYRETIKYFSQFPHLEVIEKENIPDRWHYRNSYRVPSLLIMAKPGYVINLPAARGSHGYDNAIPEMRPFFIGHGPAFISNSTVSGDMSIVDVYLLLCRLLDLKPAPNNGTMGYFYDFVKLVYLLDDLPKSIFQSNYDSNVQAAPEDNRHHAPLIVMAISISVTVLVLLILLFYACVQGAAGPKRSVYEKIATSPHRGPKEDDRLLHGKSSVEAESEDEGEHGRIL